MTIKHPFPKPLTIGNNIRTLLVYPPISKAERYGSRLGIFGGKQIPLGLFYLAACVRKTGLTVQALDAESRNLAPEDILSKLKRENFNVLGISVTTVAFQRGLELAQLVKRFLPETIVIVGGPHVSCMPTQPLEFNAFDFAVPHEGEETLVELLKTLESGGDLTLVKGIVFRQDDGIRITPKRKHIRDPDTIPIPAYDMIPDMGVYTPPPFNYIKRPVANVITSRGCPNDCTFCENATFGRKVRMRSAENIVDEIEMLMERFGIKEIAFVDDTFTLSRERIKEIFILTRKRKLFFPWSCMSRVNTVDEGLLRYMKNNGCWYIAFGIESGEPAILKEIRKKINLEDVRNTVSACNRLDIKTKGFFMIGHPKETVGSINKTIDFATSLDLDHIVVTINTPMPGSHQYRHAAEYGELNHTQWSQLNYWHPVFVPYGLSRSIILTKHREFLRKFYLRPKILLRGLRRTLRNPTDTAYQYLALAGNIFRNLTAETK